MLDQQEVEGQHLVKQLCEVEKIQNVGQDAVGALQFAENQLAVDNSQVGGVGGFLAALELVEQPELLNLEEG